MYRSLVIRVSQFIKKIENTLPEFFGRGLPPPDAFCVATIQHSPILNDYYRSIESRYSIKDIIGDGILWAVPKHRRTVEKRLKRKFGNPYYVWKLIKTKTNIKSCNTCGKDHEAGILCPHCYKKIREETEQMQEKIQEKLGLEPVEKEVVVLYEGEKGEHPVEFLNGKRIIEMEKPRPMWFSKNLLQKSTQQPATTKEVKPTDLG